MCAYCPRRLWSYLELEIQVTVSCHVEAGNRTRFSERAASALIHWAILPAPWLYCLLVWQLWGIWDGFTWILIFSHVLLVVIFPYHIHDSLGSLHSLFISSVFCLHLLRPHILVHAFSIPLVSHPIMVHSTVNLAEFSNKCFSLTYSRSIDFPPLNI